MLVILFTRMFAAKLTFILDSILWIAKNNSLVP